jgi:hypothetical protein
MFWLILYGVAVVTLFLHWRGPNAVWGSATIGFLIGVVVALFGDGFNWWTVAKAVSVAATVGTMIEWVPELLTRRQNVPPSAAPSAEPDSAHPSI